MSETILLVDDDEALTGLVARYLRDNDFELEVMNTGAGVVPRVHELQPAVLILDVMLPVHDGLSICREVRANYTGKILMLTALGDDIDEVAGLELGADDYLVKPVRPRVLLARLRALLRRGTQPATPTSTAMHGEFLSVCAGRLIVDVAAREVKADDELIGLTDAEFELLALLAHHAGEVMDRDEINQALRGLEHDGLDRTIDLRVSRVRKKLNDTDRDHHFIKSVRGKGYLLLP